MQQQNRRIWITAAIAIPVIVAAMLWPTGGGPTDADAEETTTTTTTLTTTTLEPSTTLPVELPPSTVTLPPPPPPPPPPPAPVVTEPPVVEPAAEPDPAPEPIVETGGIPDEYWDRMAQCETGGNWQHFPYGTWTGGLGIYNQTWLGWGGGEFAPTAGQATREQQIIVANRIATTGYGNLGPVGVTAWGCVSAVGYP